MRSVDLILYFILKLIIRLKDKIKFLNIIYKYIIIINKIINLKSY